MLEEDYRNISCGGDPFNFLMANIKSLAVDIKQSDIVKIMMLKDKFPYNDKVFERIAKFCKLNVIRIEREGDEIHLILKK
jgi:hypothetical protein